MYINNTTISSKLRYKIFFLFLHFLPHSVKQIRKFILIFVLSNLTNKGQDMNYLSTTIFIDGILYYLDCSQPVKRVFYSDGNSWLLSSELVKQDTAPNTAIYKWWLDSSVTPNRIKYYDGSGWKIIKMI